MTDTILSREEYEAVFAQSLIERFRVHPDVAPEQANFAVQDFLDTEGCAWGDPDYGWDREAADEHAFNWVDTARREKYR